MYENESIETLCKKAQKLLSSQIAWTAESKQNILNAIKQRNRSALIKVLKSKFTKGIETPDD